MPDPSEPPEPLRLVHHHPGRLRVRADVFRSPDEERLALARAAAETQPGVQRVVASRFTGSLLIEYVPGQVEPGAILAAVAGAAGLAGVVDADMVRRSAPDPATTLIRTVKRIDGVVREVTNGRAGLSTLVPAVLAVGALAQLLRSPMSPRWENLAYWSYSVFRDLHADEIRAAEEPNSN
jgi:heavy-metal-associated domain-containing protein